MAPQGDGLREHSMRLTKICPRIFPAAKDAFTRLQQLQFHLAVNGAVLTHPCGKEKGRDCNLVKNPSAWNDILAAINVHVKQLFGTMELEVRFNQKSFDHREMADRIQRSMLLLHWILVKHTCVVTIEVDSLGELNDREWFALFCDGIRECRRLKTLVICADLGETLAYRELLKACSFLRDLEALSLPKICDTGDTRNTAILADVISHNVKLRVLKLHGFDTTSIGSSTVVWALQGCRSLIELSLGISSLNTGATEIFLNMLNVSSKLMSLCLFAKGLEGYSTVRSVSTALQNTTALVKLELDGFELPTSDAWMLAINLVHAQTVQDLRLANSVPCFPLPTEDIHAKTHGPQALTFMHIAPYNHILQKLLCLRRLELDLLRFSTKEQRAFLENLAANGLIQHVYVKPPHGGCPIELFRIAHETGTASRVRSTPIVADEKNFGNIPRGAQLEEVILMVQVDPLIDETPPVNRCLEDLRWLDHVSHLSLVMTGNIIQLSSAKLLAEYLSTTRSLKVATLYLRAKDDSEKVLLDSIARNTSITILGVENWCLNQSSAEVLADLVCSSKRFHTLTYNRQSKVPENAFFSRLSASIERNYTLVSVSTYERMENGQNWAIIQNAVTRNAAFLERAARLVLGLSNNFIDVEDFALVASSPLLPLRVSELAAVCESQAASMIRERIWKLRLLDAVLGITSIDWLCV
ncbi:hypothetical protein MRX96_001224 [Rhipicephalus microplus]